MSLRADDDGVLPAMGMSAALKDFDTAGGGAWDQSGALGGEKADVDGMKAVNVFGRVDGEENFLDIDVGREGKLDQDAIDFVAAIEIGDEGEKFFGSGRFGGGMLLTINTDLFAGFDFAANVDFGGGIVADENNGESGAEAGGG